MLSATLDRPRDSVATTPDADARPNWSVAIFSSRETPDVLSAAVDAVLCATASACATIDIITNGNPALADAMSRYVTRIEPRSPHRTVRLWHIAVGDKALAWNHYLHAIWPGSGTTFFIDDHVRVMPNALGLMSTAMAAADHVLAGSGVPTMGRSAPAMRQQMLREGGVHGSLYALKSETMAQLRASGFRLPLGLYRTDPLLMSVILFGLDPAAHEWDTRRVLVHPEATWTFKPLQWWKPKDIRAQFKRVVRQAQGTLENRASREYLAIARKAPEGLPRTAAEFVTDWIAASPAEVWKLFRRQPLCFFTARRLRRKRTWSGAEAPPELAATARV